MHFPIQNFPCKNTNCVKPSFIKVCYCCFYTVFFVNFVSACMQATIFSNAKEPNTVRRFQSWMLVVCVAAAAAATIAVVFAFCWYDWCRERKPQFGRLFFYSLVMGKMLLIRFMQVECLRMCLCLCRCMCEFVSMQCISFIKSLRLPWIWSSSSNSSSSHNIERRILKRKTSHWCKSKSKGKSKERE